MKLNGWKRLGIVASTVWILGAGTCTYSAARDADIKFAVETEDACETATGQANFPHFSPARDCHQESIHYINVTLLDAEIGAALMAFIPVPMGWGFVYLILFLVRWITRGFNY